MTESAVVPSAPQAPSLTPFQVIEKVIGSGDLSAMKPEDRVAFYWRVCESTGLNPLTRPFEFISLNGKLTLYAKRDATDQLRRLNGVTVTKLERDRSDDLMTVTAHGRDRQGREDSAIGAVSIKGLGGEALANALMKAETKAKRRLTLSLVGLGFLDESEVDGIGDRVDVDPETGEIAPARPKPTSLLESVAAQRARLDEQAEAVLASPSPDDDTVEGDVTELPDPIGIGDAEQPAPMTAEAFRAFLTERGIDRDYATATATRLYPGVPRLDDEQRAALAAELAK